MTKGQIGVGQIGTNGQQCYLQYHHLMMAGSLISKPPAKGGENFCLLFFTIKVRAFTNLFVAILNLQ